MRRTRSISDKSIARNLLDAAAYLAALVAIAWGCIEAYRCNSLHKQARHLAEEGERLRRYPAFLAEDRRRYDEKVAAFRAEAAGHSCEPRHGWPLRRFEEEDTP